MSDPKRLFEDGGPLAQEILGSANVDRPSDAARRRAAIALGIAAASAGTAVGAGSAAAVGGNGGAAGAGAAAVGGNGALAAAASTRAAASASAAASTAVAAPALGAGAAVAKVGLVKLALAVGLAGSAAVGVGVAVPMMMTAPRVEAPETAPTPAANPARIVAPAVSAVPEISAEPSEPPATPEMSAPPELPRALPQKKLVLPRAELPAPVTAPARTTEAPRLDLAGEASLIERARTAIAAGEPHSALELLDAYAAAAPGGSLERESLQLRVDALLASHDREGALTVARRLVGRYPDAPARYRELAQAP